MLNKRTQAVLALLALFSSCAPTDADDSDPRPNKITPSLTKGGRKGYIGIVIGDEGLVRDVFAGSPADLAHIMKGDKIISINGKPIPQDNSAAGKVIMGLEGTVVALVIERAGKRYQCTVSRGEPVEDQRAVLNGQVPRPRTSIVAERRTTHNASVGPKVAADQLDRSIVSIHRRTADTDNAYDQVVESLHIIPQDLKSKMAEDGFKVVITPTIIDAFPEKVNERPSGYTHGGNYTNCPALCRGKTIYVAERVQRGSAVAEPMTHLVATFMHEFGHAYDHCYRVSNSDAFMKAYEADCQRLTNTVRDKFYYYTQPGEAGPAEMFAELSSSALSPPAHRKSHSEDLARHFPKSAEYVKNRFALER